MSDWDVFAPTITSKIEEEEEDYEFIEMEETPYVDNQQSQSYCGPECFPKTLLTEESILINPTKNKRDDRTHFKHKTGDGFRRMNNHFDRDIAEAVDLYNEGVGSYNDQLQRLREADINELVPQL